MAAIWAAENRYRIWFEIEALAAEEMARIGAIPEEAARTIREKGGAKIACITQPDLERIDAIERETRHDVIAFLTWLAEAIGPDSRFVHQGMTSSDVLDTCLSVQLAQATDLLRRDLDAVLGALKARAFEHKFTPTIGRSHGIHAEPTTFGLKLAQAYAEFVRNRERLTIARDQVATCAISGAVGTFANIPPSIEAHVAAELGLTTRETEVLVLLARGYTNREIADELVISVKTASVHVSHILQKLGAPNRREAAAILHRLMPVPPQRV